MTNRRGFLKCGIAFSALGACGPAIVPRHVLGGLGYTPPSEKITLSGIGVGGIGHPQLKDAATAGFQIVALCDIDRNYAEKTYTVFPQARRYQDFRELIASEGDKTDAVYCGTPDHTHAIITLAALKAKKHVCCVKPLTRTVEECRAVAEAARKAGVATQVTARPNTSEAACRIAEWMQAGIIGEVREAHSWSARPVWPQGMTAYPDFKDPVPSHFDWEQWLGPAEKRPYAEAWPKHIPYPDLSQNWKGRAVFHPFNFRGWTAFGTGSLGDMGCHRANTVYRVLKLRYPSRVEVSCTRRYAISFPIGCIATYDYPAREGFPELRYVWYDGGLRPPTPKQMVGRPLPTEGTLYIGDKGVILDDAVKPDTPPVVLDPALAKKAESVPRTLTRRGGVMPEWLEACKGKGRAGCDFDWAVPLTEFVLLGNLALQTGKAVEFNPETLTISNNSDAEALIRQPYHNGWTLGG